MMTGRYIQQVWIFSLWGINITLWFALITTMDLIFADNFVNLSFVQIFNCWCLSYSIRLDQRTLNKNLTVLTMHDIYYYFHYAKL